MDTQEKLQQAFKDLYIEDTTMYEKLQFDMIDKSIIKRTLKSFGIRGNLFIFKDKRKNSYIIINDEKYTLKKFKDTTTYKMSQDFKLWLKQFPKMKFLLPKGFLVFKSDTRDGYLIELEISNRPVFLPTHVLKDFVEPIIRYKYEKV